MSRKRFTAKARREIEAHHKRVVKFSYAVAFVCLILLALDLYFKVIELSTEHTFLIALILAALIVPFATKVTFEGIEVDLSDEDRKAALPEGRTMVVPGSTDSPWAVETNEQTLQ